MDKKNPLKIRVFFKDRKPKIVSTSAGKIQFSVYMCSEKIAIF